MRGYFSFARRNACRYIANVTVYILASPDPPVHFLPPLGSNRTYVVYVREERPDGYFVFQPVVRDVDNPSAVFRFQLNCSDNRYLAIEPRTGEWSLTSSDYWCRSVVVGL